MLPRLGIIHEGNLGGAGYSMSMLVPFALGIIPDLRVQRPPFRTLKIYGAPHRRPELESLLRWATPGQKGFTDALRPAGHRAAQMSASIPSGSFPTYPLIGPPGL